jgi:hypothetical protein
LRGKKPLAKQVRAPSPGEKYGHIWAGIYAFIVLLLIFTLVGKACLSSG